MPWAKGNPPPIGLLDRADDKGSVVANLQPGVIANIKGCDGSWCRVTIVMDGARDVDGYIQPGEAVGRLSQREGRIGFFQFIKHSRASDPKVDCTFGIHSMLNS